MLQASPAGILTILGLNLLPSEVTSRRVSQEEQRDYIGTAMHICLLTNASRVQMAGDAAGHAQLCFCRAVVSKETAQQGRSGNDDVKIGALETLGNLAFQPKNRAAFMADTDLLAWISRLAQDQVRSEGGALADPRRCVVRDANDKYVCLCWLSRHSLSQICARCVPLQQTQLALGATAGGRLLAAVRSMRCRHVTQTRLAPSFSCAAGAEALQCAPSAGGRLEEEGERGGHQGAGNTRAER